MASNSFIMVFAVLSGILLLSAVFGLLGWIRGRAPVASREADLARIERKLDLLLADRDIRYDPLEGLPVSIPVLVKQGKTIEAIKLYRETKGVGLKEAKDAIDEIRRLDP